jgi:acetyl-CoA hydrolase
MGHEPHLLFQAFKMHQHLSENGTMKINSWE